jgi:hypothetical protein
MATDRFGAMASDRLPNIYTVLQFDEFGNGKNVTSEKLKDRPIL